MTPIQFLKNIKISDNIKKAILFTLILGIFTHIFFLTNKTLNHDDLEQLVSNMDYSTSGRWFLQYANLPSSNFSMPWVNGLFIIFYTGIICAIIVKIFEIKSTLYIFLLSGIFIMFTSNSALFHYTNSADAYSFGAMLSMIGVYLFIKYKNGFIFTILLTVLSLATYQTYIGLNISILVIYYLFKMIKNEISHKEFILDVFRILLTYLIAIILYIISVKYIFNIQLSNYQNLDKMGNIDLLKLPKYIFNAFIQFFGFFLLDTYYQFGLLKYVNGLIIISTLYLFYIFIKKINTEKKILSWITLLLLPIFMNLIFIIAPTSAIGLRMLQGYFSFYILIFILMESTEVKNNKKFNSITLSLWIITIGILTSLYHFYILTNKVYLTLEIDTINVNSYTTRVLSKIEDQEFYNEEKPLFLIGNPDITTNFTEKYTTPDVVKSTILDKKIAANYLWKLLPERYLAFPNHIENIWKVDYDVIEDSELVKKIDNAKIYPKEGSIFEHKGSIYIKFKDYKN